MKGLELSHLYYTDMIQPLLRERFPEYVNRIAVGLVGEGSECYGYDDDISRDHDWGAKVCLWLNPSDYHLIGSRLQRELEGLQHRFHGYPVVWIPGRNGVLEIGSFFKKYLKLNRSPKTLGEWLGIPEHHLATASNGAVFYDPLGTFSSIWENLRLGYPEDIRLKKLAARCMTIAQAGQYNYPRLMKRQDLVGAMLAKSEFMQAVISAVYLLNNRYTPFYKWMFYGMKQLPVLGEEIGALLEQLVCSETAEERIEQICRLLIAEFVHQKITDVRQEETYLVAHGESIHQHIQMEALRNTNPWVDKI